MVAPDVTKFRLVDQLKSDMVSTVSHELKTPLTSIQMAVHLLLEEARRAAHAKQVELLLAARQDSDRLLAMVNDLLDLTRIEQGRVRLDLRPVAPADLVAREARPVRARRGREASRSRAPSTFGLPPVRVDRERIGHVFDNLIGNALAHTARRRVELAAAVGDVVGSPSRTPARGSRPSTCRVFENFYRVPGCAVDRAGLGLAIAQELASPTAARSKRPASRRRDHVHVHAAEQPAREGRLGVHTTRPPLAIRAPRQAKDRQSW